jgi:nucleolar MIF4G domain-containing protein 1
VLFLTGIVDSLPRRPRGYPASTTRKDRRRVERAQKKGNGYGLPPSKRFKLRHAEASNVGLRADKDLTRTTPLRLLTDQTPWPRSVLKVPKQPDKPDNPASDLFSPSTTPKKLSKAVAAKLAEDDAEIAALERKLGIKSKKQLPKSFENDGLSELLDGLDEGSDGGVRESEEKSAKGKLWFAQKRQKTKSFHSREAMVDEALSSGDESAGSGTFLDVKEFSRNDQDGSLFFEGGTSLDVDDEFIGFDTDHDDAVPSSPGRKRMRENPYVPPKLQDGLNSTKYLPPSLRKPTSSESQALTQLRRQTQGLVNRLTEANLMTILSDVESLYRENARQNVTSTLVDILLTSVCEPTSLPDTLIILPAGFIAAIYKVVGNDFGAEVIQKIVELFDQHYAKATNGSIAAPVTASLENTKETSNLVTLLAELYNFQVIGSNLIFDYVRQFLSSLSSLNAELLLRIIRVSGPRLRQDDPSSLKDIVNVLRPAVARIGEENISVRTKFLIETINDLKNNRMKTGAVTSTVTSEHTIRMKKILGTLNARSIKASEPMRIGLKDIHDSDKKGKWWLVGASWAGIEVGGREVFESSKSDLHEAEDRFFPGGNNSEADLVQLAREQRMNTDIRRAIFVTIMSASDYQDAYLRLTKLKLKKVQELEIPKVLIRCSGAENSYNPYYTLIAQKLCGDRKLKMALQFGLWDIFRRLGEDKENGNEEVNMVEEEEHDDFLNTRQLVNVAKMFGTLIMTGSVNLTVLKILNLGSLQARTQMFVEVLCITLLLQLQRASQEGRDEEAIVKTFSKLKDAPQMIRSLQYFLKKVVSKTDIAGGETERAIVKRACKIASRVLESLLAATPEPA